MPKATPHTTDPKAEASGPKFQTVRPARAFEEIATQIRTELTEGRLRVGSRLPAERALALQFGVSRNTLREALRSLEHAGLIRLQKGATGGAFVSEGSGNAIINSMVDLYNVGSVSPSQLTEARIWLESIIVREACERATAESLQALQACIDAAHQASEAGDFDRRFKLHLEFHRMLTRMTGNPIMVIVMDGLLTVLQQFILTIGAYENTFIFASRKRFMKHMTDKNPQAAVAEMENSLKRLQRVYLSRAEAPTPSPTPMPMPMPTVRRTPTARKKSA